jgi:transposase
VGRRGIEFECRGRAQAAKAGPREGGQGLDTGVGQGRQGGGLAEIDAAEGFRVLPRRWVVERTFAWISHNRRMAKDYERLCTTGEAFVYAAMTRLMVRWLARA